MSSTAQEGLQFDLSSKRIGELITLADSAAAAASTGWHEVSTSLQPCRDAADIDAIAVAFDYRMTEAGEADESVFASAWTLGGKTYPAPLGTLPTSVADLWAAVADSSSTSPVRARLNDLLFSLGRQPRHIHAERACLAYLELSVGNWIPLYRALALVRALDIARQMKRDDLAQRTMAQMITDAREYVEDAEWHPGVPFRLLKRLVAEKNPPEAVDDLLATARTRYADDPHIEADVAALQRRRAKGNKDELDRIDREIATIWIAAAETTWGLRKMNHLIKAIEYSRNHGHNDLVAQATKALQEIDNDEMGLQSIRRSVEIPGEQIRRWVDHIAADDDWRVCLQRFTHGGIGVPPSGLTDENRARVEVLKQQAPLFSMTPRVMLGGDGLPRWRPQDDDERELQKLAFVESTTMDFTAPIFAQALVEIGTNHSPSREELQDFFVAQNPSISAEIARVLADCLLRYWSGDDEACVYLLAPKIETMLRNLARSLDEPVYQTQRNTTPGKYVGVGVLLQFLGKRGLDESWGRYLAILLSSPMGWNARNELAHGFFEGVPGPLAALLLQAALYIATLQPSSDEPSEDGDGSS
ncbi:DUF4209 domain-containing protein [Amycolatopsis eburnea]|uniref:DUF4209 domain-containing protein n=1 Tax=Amycolatopsis eburnea TaxID=2267691 RepID=UPI00131523AF|nr:DUF4209 domain-containing protein [Amycolatopsis eburnea]